MAKPRGIGDEVIRLLQENKSYSEICSELSCSKGTVGYYAKKLGISKTLPVYNYAEINEFYHSEEDITLLDCTHKFGCSSQALTLAVSNGLIIKKDKSIPLDKLFVENSTYSPKTVRAYVERYSLLDYKCQICSNEGTWNGNSLKLQIDHINGVNNDHRLENLRYLCPNCHTQTETYAGKNLTNPDRKTKFNYIPVKR